MELYHAHILMYSAWNLQFTDVYMIVSSLWNINVIMFSAGNIQFNHIHMIMSSIWDIRLHYSQCFKEMFLLCPCWDRHSHTVAYPRVLHGDRAMMMARACCKWHSHAVSGTQIRQQPTLAYCSLRWHAWIWNNNRFACLLGVFAASPWQKKELFPTAYVVYLQSWDIRCKWRSERASWCTVPHFKILRFWPFASIFRRMQSLHVTSW